MTEKPKGKSSFADQELSKVEKQLESFENEIKGATLDRMNQAPKLEVEPQTKIAQSDLAKMKDIYLKPSKVIMAREKFNEEFREQYNFEKEYVHFIAENKEIPGETMEFWTKRFPGQPAEFWQIPANKPVWAPRYVAEQITKCKYHRLYMQDKPTHGDEKGNTYYGTMTIDKAINRLDAYPVQERKSIFMGADAA
jgi:hypothetical protein